MRPAPLLLVLVLSLWQLAQGLAMRFEMVEPETVRPIHIGVGVLTALILLGLVRSARIEGGRIGSDLTFVFLLMILQGLAGLFILAEISLATIIHLALSFFVVGSVAATLILAASETG